jgi:hypothetical protein
MLSQCSQGGGVTLADVVDDHESFHLASRLHTAKRFRDWCKPKPRTFSWCSPKGNRTCDLYQATIIAKPL